MCVAGLTHTNLALRVCNAFWPLHNESNDTLNRNIYKSIDIILE